MKTRTKTATLIAIFLILALSVALLINNKSKNIAKAKKIVVLTKFPVYVSRATYEDVNLKLEFNGTVHPNAEVNISSETNGKVVFIGANLGDYVSKGALLVKLDDRIRLANYQTAKANFDKVKKDYERYQQLYNEKSVSESQMEQIQFQYLNAEAQLKIAEKQLEESRITAPFSGFITSKMVEVGQVVSPGTPLMNLIDIGTVKIRIQVPEKEVLAIKPGDEVIIKTELIPNEKYVGKIQSLGFKSDESKTYPAEIIVNNKRNLLKGGMFVKVEIPSIKRGRALLIPREALVGSKLEPKVYVVENNIAKLRDVVLGNDYGKKLEVTQGLSDGDLVVVEGLLNLKDGTSVEIVEQR
ncbi:MAG: efflux RND transporter periplasmic adaptor subunit [Candidatus Kapaibacteriota bacterium]